MQDVSQNHLIAPRSGEPLHHDGGQLARCRTQEIQARSPIDAPAKVSRKGKVIEQDGQ